MKNMFEGIIKKAEQLLKENKNNEAIELLRCKESPNDAVLCALLARAYFQRGDSKGDTYSAHFFAERAVHLGHEDNRVRSILALTSFRKEDYQQAVDIFSRYVNSSSPSATQFMYGMSLLYNHQAGEAVDWLKRAVKLDQHNEMYAKALKIAQEQRENGGKIVFAEVPEAGVQPDALSKKRGLADSPQDFYWLSKNIPCQEACPAHTNIPEYLRAIYDGDYEKAYLINLKDNVFPAILGRVCARPCESECRHGWDGLGTSVQICFSKRAGADLRQDKPVILNKLYPPSGKKVSVIGAGVAGLTAARQLALYGHSVTVYEKHNRPGGMLNQGIPIFRLPREIIDREIDQIRQLGVEIKCNCAVGKDISLDTLINTSDAVVMSAGTVRPNILNLPGKDLSGIRHGLDFLLQVNEFGAREIGKNVVVIGGGFTAMDCARTAKRLGAESVKVCYRRSTKEMLVTPGEIEELEHESIPLDLMVTPCGYKGSNGKVTHVTFIKTKLGEPDASGRRKPVEIPGSEYDEPADTVLLATGQFPDTAWIGQSLSDKLVDDDQWLKSGKSVTTQIGKIFAAGDFATGARSLIDAIGHAKECARAVDAYIMNKKRIKDVARIVDATGTGRIREMDFVDYQQMPTIDLDKRSLTAEVETGFDKTLAVDETQRCYLCHYKYEIDSDICIYCDWCIKAKPRPNCIVKVKELIRDEHGRITGFVRAKEHEDTQLIWINQEDCIRCNACVDACPVDCISIQKVSLDTCRACDVDGELNKD
ncbi:MAG: FAD-dependent oxidoreductase [Candidatus Auribacterota bacterium]